MLHAYIFSPIFLQFISYFQSTIHCFLIGLNGFFFDTDGVGINPQQSAGIAGFPFCLLAEVFLFVFLLFFSR